MAIDDTYLETCEHMEAAVKALEARLKSIRTGRASPALLEHIKVDYYGTKTPLQQLANISVPEARLLVIKPFDPSSLEAISKAIIGSDLGLNPMSDGKVLRVAMPPMTEETRKKQSAIVKDEGEKAKISIRNARRDAMKAIDEAKKKGETPEDDCIKMKDDVQKQTDESEKKTAEVVERKTKEIMEL
jgi:ribosome recycling factor